MDLKLPFLGLACSTLAFAQAVAPAPAAPAPSAPVGFPAPSYLPPGAGTPEITRAVELHQAETEEVILCKERVCQGFLTLPLLEDLHATVRAHLERQFRRPGTGL